jgi:ABC-2 type transport system permease protein
MTMSMTTQAPPAAVRRSPLAQLTRVELRLFLRERIGPVWGIGLPVLLLVIFGAIPSFRKVLAGSGGLTVLDSYLPILIALSLALLALVALPFALCGSRERGILRRLRTTPAGPVRLLSAQLIVNFATLVVTLIAILALARVAYSVPLPRQLGGWVVAALFAAAALFAIGLFIAAVAPTARVGAATGNIAFFPMMFFSGLWLPIPSMPSVLQHISHATPLGAAWEAFQQTDLGHWPPALSLVTMGVWAVVFGAGAARFFRWE